MDYSLKGNWGNRDDDDFLFQIAFGFVAQVKEIMRSGPISPAQLAKKLGVSKGRVSQILNNPGNLELKNIVRYARALDYKVAIVAYDDGDPQNTKGPINPRVLAECWHKCGRPHDAFEVRGHFQL